MKDDSKNYKTIFVGNSIFSFAEGFYMPFLITFLFGLGGMPLLGAGLGLVLIFDSIGTYIAGKLVDKYNRKPFFLIIPIISIVTFIAYPIIPFLDEIMPSLMLPALFLLFIIDGMQDGFWGIVETVYLAEITSKTTRGSKIGSYWG